VVRVLYLQVTREKLESWVNEPFFEKACVGAFVRVVIGTVQDGDENKAVYRMGIISNVEKGNRQYKLTHFKGQTDMRLSVSIGKQVKNGIKMTLISNSRPTPQEFETYKSDLAKSRGYFMLTKKVRLLCCVLCCVCAVLWCVVCGVCCAVLCAVTLCY
jgi:RNA polymerase-associated protein RTF1